MISEIEIILAGNPIAKMRSRVKRIGSKIMSYDPQDKEKKEAIKHLEYKIHINEKRTEIQLDAALHLWVGIYIPVPKSNTKAQKKAKLDGFELPIKRPDIDNYLKFYLDVANGLLYKDDSQAIAIFAHKQYSENPRTEIKIKYIG